MKVLLSSTALDLVAHRKVADDTILRLSQQSIVMERFGPLPDAPVAECERKARECDLVVCIVAHRYGFEPEPGKGSITRREVEAARAAGKDVLVWIVADDYLWPEVMDRELLRDPMTIADPIRIAEVEAAVRALDSFKTWLRASYICETFTTPNDLGRKIAVALASYLLDRAPTQLDVVRQHGEIRIIHALQPAPHFHGRTKLLKELRAWVADVASPDRVWSLVAAGGTGKTAVVEQVVSDLHTGEANVLVWSFYESPSADTFLRECNQLFLGEVEGPPGGRLERLQQGLRDGRPHLIVLDGLEQVQEDAGAGRVRGELSDQTLKLLLRSLAAGLGRTRALVTSRFPLVDLQDWLKRGNRETQLDDLTPRAAVAVLRGWGVVGTDASLRLASAQVGHHALSVAVIGSYLQSFAAGRIEDVAAFDLDSVTGDDAKAAKLKRVLEFYADHLPPEELALLSRLSMFPRGVSLDILGAIVNAGGEVAGPLVDMKHRLVYLLGNLKRRGLVFMSSADSSDMWTAHPFLREWFRKRLGCPPERVFGVVSARLSIGLESRPSTTSSEPDTLDRYEQLIEALVLAGREQEAFELYWYGLGRFEHLGKTLGDYNRGYRTVVSFSATGRPEDLAPKIMLAERAGLANALGMFAEALGQLDEAWTAMQVNVQWTRLLGLQRALSLGLQNSGHVAFLRGRLRQAQLLAENAQAAADAADDREEMINAQAYHANASHALGEVAKARAGFVKALALEGKQLASMRGSQYARHLLDLGDLGAARRLCEAGLQLANRHGWFYNVPRFQSVLSRAALAVGRDPSIHLDKVRSWTSRTGELHFIIEAHLLTALHLLATGDPQTALGECESGLLHAVACGYGILRIELLVALARIRLAWPDAPAAIHAAREALDLATDAECGYAWGEADAAQVWGEAHFANREPELAKRAFSQALAVRRRIKHPKVAETVQWLARIG